MKEGKKLQIGILQLVSELDSFGYKEFALSIGVDPDNTPAMIELIFHTSDAQAMDIARMLISEEKFQSCLSEK